VGKMVESPRYNVVSARLDDDEWCQLQDIRGEVSQSDFVRQAVLEKIQKEEVSK